jgi:glycosyltransferase involved in cell wall biosynthesis
VKQLGLLPDYTEEGWPSMDLCAEMLEQHFPANPDLKTVMFPPPWRSRFGRIPIRRGLFRNVDRLFNRWFTYPAFLRSRLGEADLFHVVDHSYAHLLREIPPGRGGVYCHDIDAFRCILTPKAEPRPLWFRAMMRRVLDGLSRAAVVFHSTLPVRESLLEHRLVDAARLIHAPLGIAGEFHESGVPVPDKRPYLLHVGSSIPRKRVDVLLEVFAALATDFPDLDLVQIGGTWNADHIARIESQGLSARVRQMRGLPRQELAAWYRGAKVVLQPSEAEGFGLPLIESLACGAVVVASDLPVFREIAGNAVIFAPVGDVPVWTETIRGVLRGTLAPPAAEVRRAVAGRYSWATHARIIAEGYRSLLSTNAVP